MPSGWRSSRFAAVSVKRWGGYGVPDWGVSHGLEPGRVRGHSSLFRGPPSEDHMSPLVRRKLKFMAGVALTVAIAAYVGRDKGSPFDWTVFMSHLSL